MVSTTNALAILLLLGSACIWYIRSSPEEVKPVCQDRRDMTMCWEETSIPGRHQCMESHCVPNQCWTKLARGLRRNGVIHSIWVKEPVNTPCLSNGRCTDSGVCDVSGKNLELVVPTDDDELYSSIDDDSDFTPSSHMPTIIDPEAPIWHHHEIEASRHECWAYGQRRMDGLQCARGKGECIEGVCYSTNPNIPYCDNVCITSIYCSSNMQCVIEDVDTEWDDPTCMGKLAKDLDYKLGAPIPS